MQERPDRMTKISFTPIPFLHSGYWQTVLGSFGLPLFEPPSENRLVGVSEGDKLCCRESTPKGWQDGGRIALLLHGMAGSHRSPYMVRLARALHSRGQKVVRINLRGCGCGAGLARLPHNAGASNDLLTVLQEVRRDFPRSSIQVAAFSMGGNILLKMLGELGKEGGRYVEKGIAVCPGVDPLDCVKKLQQGGMKLIQAHYLQALIRIIIATEKSFPDVRKFDYSKITSIFEFDNLYTAPKLHYESAPEYYRDSKAAQYVPDIRVPCEILYDADDPVVDYRTIESLDLPGCVRLWKTKGGGHMGYLGFSENGVRWMDGVVLRWLTEKE